MDVCCECCVLSGRNLGVEVVTRSEESYRMWCVVLCDLEISRMRRTRPALGRGASGGGGGGGFMGFLYFSVHNKISQVGDELFNSKRRTDGWKNIKNLTDAFRNLAKAHNEQLETRNGSLSSSSSFFQRLWSRGTFRSRYNSSHPSLMGVLGCPPFLASEFSTAACVRLYLSVLPISCTHLLSCMLTF